MTQERFLKPGEVAAQMRVQTNTVYAWIKRGKLRAVKIGDTLRIKESDLIQAIENVQVEAKA